MSSVSNNSEDEHYLSMATAYDNRVDAILPNSDAFFSSCLSFIPEGSLNVLELGSGTGYATSKIRKLNPHAVITCIDHSSEMIQYASKKPELDSVQIIEQDIRDPWPESRYDLIISTLCFHHIPSEDRLPVLNRVYEVLSSDGFFICGDIIRPVHEKEEEVYQQRWVRSMLSAGMSMEEITPMIHSRKENYPGMETIEAFYKKMNDTGFSLVLMPYKHEISAVFIGYR
jgi:tRNA (cmo5U34)-methyltransferase